VPRLSDEPKPNRKEEKKMRRELILGLLIVAMLLATVAPLGIVRANPETTVVTPSNMNGWFFLEETASGLGALVVGPDTPPMGVGSARFVVDATGGLALIKPGYDGLKLSEIVTLSYWTYQSASSPSTTTQQIALQFNIDYDCTDGDTSWQGRLVFEPYWNPDLGTPAKGVWQQWDARAGKWWSSKPGYISKDNPQYFDDILSLYPNACIHPIYGAVLLKAGGAWSPGFDGNADGLVINEDTYDFELFPSVYDQGLAQGSPLNNGFDNGYRWVQYGNILCRWTWDGSKYTYTWEEDRDLNGVTMEGWVEVDYGPYYDWMIAHGYPDADSDGLIERFESGDVPWYTDPSPVYRTGKVVHLTMTWVPGVTVPGGENRFIIKYDGAGRYIGGYQTVLFWDYTTIQGDPPGPFLIMNKFYYVEFVDTSGFVTGGFYVEYQYMAIPE